MTNKQEQSLKAKIARSLGTKAQFVRIDSAEWEDPEKTLGERVAAAESFCRAYTAAHGGYIDYIHGDDTARTLG